MIFAFCPQPASFVFTFDYVAHAPRAPCSLPQRRLRAATQSTASRHCYSPPAICARTRRVLHRFIDVRPAPRRRDKRKSFRQRSACVFCECASVRIRHTKSEKRRIHIPQRFCAQCRSVSDADAASYPPAMRARPAPPSARSPSRAYHVRPHAAPPVFPSAVRSARAARFLFQRQRAVFPESP